MTMDEQHCEMKLFLDDFIEFNTRLRSALNELRQRHEYLSPIWQDEMRRHYDAQWQPFYETISHYDQVEGKSYVEFLAIKLHALERYLRG